MFQNGGNIHPPGFFKKKGRGPRRRPDDTGLFSPNLKPLARKNKLGADRQDIGFRGPRVFSVHSLKKISICLALVFLFLSVPKPAVADEEADFQMGVDAYIKGDIRTAIGMFKAVAEQGRALAQFNLGLIYSQGQGIPRDYQEALKWFRKAAEQGLAEAQSNLGWMYRHGFGVSRDFKEALKWYRLAAEQGQVEAQFNLGWMYRHGFGVSPNYIKAVKWYRLAAEQGLAKAQLSLGVMYDDGLGVPQDYKEALKWYQLAANQGLAKAQFNLGWILLNGRGVSQDYVQAHMWFNLAGVEGYKDAVRNRGLAEQHMTLQEILKAQKLAREWKPKKKIDLFPNPTK